MYSNEVTVGSMLEENLYPTLLEPFVATQWYDKYFSCSF